MSLQKQGICLLSKHFALIAVNNVKITFRSTKKMLASLPLHSGKLFLISLLYFSVSGCGNSAPYIYCRMQLFFSWYASRTILISTLSFSFKTVHVFTNIYFVAASQHSDEICVRT